MNYFEIKKTSKSIFFPYTYVSLILVEEVVEELVEVAVKITLKIQNNYTEISFVECAPPHKYKVIDVENIKISDTLGLNDENHNDLKYCYESSGNGAVKEFNLIFTIPLKHLQKHEGQYKLKFKGENKNNSNTHAHNLHPEEGIIIFEPPPEIL